MEKELKAAVELAAARMGGHAALARKLGLSPSATWQWKRVPASRVLRVAELTGLPEYSLRPDLYREAAA